MTNSFIILRIVSEKMNIRRIDERILEGKRKLRKTREKSDDGRKKRNEKHGSH